MSNFKNTIIEIFKDNFVKQNPQFTTDDEETIAFCNKQLNLIYEPYNNYINDKKKLSYDLEAQINNFNVEQIDKRTWVFNTQLLITHSVFNERPSLKKYTAELIGFDNIRYYFDLVEFENAVIPFLKYDINISILDLIEALEYNRLLKYFDVLLNSLKMDRSEIINDIKNQVEKNTYNAKRPRAKKEIEVEFEPIEAFAYDKFNITKNELINLLLNEFKSAVKSRNGMEIMKNILNQIIESHKTKKGFSQSKLFASIQSFIFLLFDNNQLGIKTKEAFDESNSKTIKEEYESNYKKYYNNRIRSLIFKL